MRTQMLFRTFGLSIFLSLVASLGQAQHSCNMVYRDQNPRLLDNYDFSSSPDSHISHLFGHNKRVTKNSLIRFSQEFLQEQGVQIHVRKVLGIPSAIQIAPEGTHWINKIAKRIHEKDGTRLIYDPSQLKEDLASYDPFKRIIYVSHAVGLKAKFDTSTFHEIEHWTITRRTREGTKNDLDLDVQKRFWSTLPFAPKSLYESYINFQEVSAWTFEARLAMRNLMKIQTDKIGPLIFHIQELRGTLLEARDIAGDQTNYAKHMIDLLEQGELKISVRSHQNAVIVYVKGKGLVSTLSLPIENLQPLKSMTKDQQREFVISHFKETLSTTEKFGNALDRSLPLIDRININSTSADVQKALSQAWRELSQD